MLRNLVVYQTKDQKVMWASNTMNSGAIVAKMQPDGNFVLYNAGNSAKWASGTNGRPGAILKLLDTGDLVVYTSLSNFTVLWTSTTTITTNSTNSYTTTLYHILDPILFAPILRRNRLAHSF